MPYRRTSRLFTISFPPDLAAKAVALAQRDSRTMSELFREAFRVFYAQDVRKTMNEIGEYAVSRPSALTEADVPGLIREVRESNPSKNRAKPQEPRRRRA